MCLHSRCLQEGEGNSKLDFWVADDTSLIVNPKHPKF